jgi:energy-coupling factor transport system ATP-binding protein
LDECAAIADRIAFMSDGMVLYAGTPEETLSFLNKQDPDFVPALPKASLRIDNRVALTPRAFKECYPTAPKKLSVNVMANKRQKPYILECTDITAGYPHSNRPVLHRLFMRVSPGEVVCVTGGNGSGKSTLLRLAAGIHKPVMGRVKIRGKAGYLPQQVPDYFRYDTVREEIAAKNEWTERFKLDPLWEKHPLDISGGEQQKCAVLSILAQKPDILVLDEPTKGMDPVSKNKLGKLIRETGLAAIIATHDLEFAAKWADRCAMLFDGEIVYTHNPRDFFAGNRYYTTAIHKGLRHLDENAVFYEDVHDLWDLRP